MVPDQVLTCHLYSLSYYAQAESTQSTDVLADNALLWSDLEICILYRACLGAGEMAFGHFETVHDPED